MITEYYRRTLCVIAVGLWSILLANAQQLPATSPFPKTVSVITRQITKYRFYPGAALQSYRLSKNDLLSDNRHTVRLSL